MNKFFKKWKKEVWVGVIGLALTFLVLAIIGINLWRQGYIGQSNTDEVQETACKFNHPLTGVCFDYDPFEGQLPPPVLAVMIENSADAWPQSGLDQAFMVIEAPTEANIPRLLAFFDSLSTAEKIGPVRSARPYFVDLASMFQSLYAHVGGSPAALSQLKTTELVQNFDEYFNQYNFWRDSSRYAPHNVYTSIELLMKGWGHDNLDYQTYQFKNDEPVQNETTQKVMIDFGSPSYRATWQYDPENNNYIRWQSAHEDKMADGTIISADNVVVMEMSMDVLDSVGRISVDTVGEGKGYLIQDGQMIEIDWQREKTSDIFTWIDAQGESMALNTGVTWIEIIPSLSQVTEE